MPNFDWGDLRAFLAIVRAGRLTVAARRMGIDHSTLRRRLTALETALGARLFDRRAAGLVLTPEGESMVADAEAMETLASRMASGFDNATQNLSGTVRLGT